LMKWQVENIITWWATVDYIAGRGNIMLMKQQLYEIAS
jgi:hypothetical protein